MSYRVRYLDQIMLVGPSRCSINVHSAKARLSELLERAASGEEVVIAKRGKPFVRLVAVEDRSPRRPGIAKGRLTDAFSSRFRTRNWRHGGSEGAARHACTHLVALRRSKAPLGRQASDPEPKARCAGELRIGLGDRHQAPPGKAGRGRRPARSDSSTTSPLLASQSFQSGSPTLSWPGGCLARTKIRSIAC